MEQFQTIILIVSAIALFVYGLQSFSRELQEIGSDRLRRWIAGVTEKPLGGFFLGAFATAMVQSSTMVSSLTVTFVDAAVISFRSSLQILLGANIGTTSTAWIVTFQSALFGPVFIVLGTLVSMVPARIATLGRAIFYFGFIFFSLSLISQAVEPLKSDAMVQTLLLQATQPLLGILYGIILTVVVQSSSVVIGVCIVLVSQGIMTIDAAVPIVIGANVGTTSTAMIVSLKMSKAARLSAFANIGFNFIAMLLIFPFIGWFIDLLIRLTPLPAIQIAAATTLFSAFTSLLFLIVLNPVHRLLTGYLSS
ncbi:Na/Pi cotransporter family protein [Parapedobacter soli]|uniref:Na/Pi cotransporter family protein n=1 Tax=Parapedobacter soli TaxID=416955 RepID=UPI0021C72E68|nr:Na/Pi symporter [Parapedobacter soli]